jgi:hypothetical protein
MEIQGYEFEGPYKTTDEVSEYQLGVYVVACLVNDTPHCVLDVGTSEGGSGETVTPTGNLQHRLDSHGRSNCWDEATHEETAYYVKYVNDKKTRLAIEKELQWRYEPICGTLAWEQDHGQADEIAQMEAEYGTRGLFDDP